MRDVIEKFSIVKALEAMRTSRIALVLIDAAEGIVEQDLHLIQFAIESNNGILLVVNKWDLLDSESRTRCRNEVVRRLRFAEWIRVRYVSALREQGISQLFDEIQHVFDKGSFDASASELTELLNGLVAAHTPPLVNNRFIKLRYAHRVDTHPPSIVVHGNQTHSVPQSYKRYLEKGFRQALGLDGWPVVVSFRSSRNPFASQRNVLTDRQKRKRRRMVKRRKQATR